MRSLAAHLRVLLAVLPVAGCVLLISPDTPGDHCGFKGSTGCAACIRQKCQDAVDGCCKDASCSGSYVSAPVLDTVDQCGEGKVADCAKGLGGSQYGAAETVRKCVVQQCNDACTGGAVAAEWSCTAAREKKNDCATCVYETCSAALDKCCGDSSCSKSADVQKDVGGCVAGDAKSCAFMPSKSQSGLEGVVRACIQKSCGSACIGDARPHASCTLLSGGTHCTCKDAQVSSGPDCSATAVGGECAIGAGGCGCGEYGCSTGTTCTCSFGSSASGKTCGKPASGRCCIKLDASGVSCTCDTYTFACAANQNEFTTPSCDKDAVLSQLRGVSRLVPACSN